MFELLGACLALAALLTANAIASLLTSVLWRAVSARAQNWPAVTRSRILFALRAYPAVGALIIVLALLGPSYLIYEPRHTSENVSIGLWILSVASVIGIALALSRGAAAWMATRRLLRAWLTSAERIELEGVAVPAFLIRHPFPVVAVVGAFRPRLFIAETVVANLSESEIRAAIAHECGHLSARDNLKRAVLRACRDSLMIVPCGRTLDSAWTYASEEAADELAVENRPALAMDLASALIEIARLVPEGGSPTMPAAAFLMGEADAGTISHRVKRLLETEGISVLTPGPFAKLLNATPQFVALLFVLAVGIIALSPNNLAMVHSALEWIVAVVK